VRILSMLLRQSPDGERVVAQYLDWFRTKEFFVFHDVPDGDANIDHVPIGTRGLFVIETKTPSKPLRGRSSMTFSDGRLLANGRPLDRDPIVQARAQARWPHNFLAKSQFKQFVQPVVVFPG
jgi:Nuclease-related domain